MSAEFRAQIGPATVKAGYAVTANSLRPQGAALGSDGWATFLDGRPAIDMREPFVSVDPPYGAYGVRLSPEEASLLAATLTAAAAFAARQAEEARRQGPPPSPLEVKP